MNSGLTERRVTSLAVNRQGNLLVGTDGGGVFRSENWGDSWSPVNNGMDFLSISKIAISSTDSIFAGTGNSSFGIGVYRSTDNTASWSLVNDGITTGGFVTAMVENLDGRVFAAFGFADGYYQTDNDGDEWSYHIDIGGVADLFVGETGRILAGVSMNLQEGAVFQSLDNGDTWSRIFKTDPGVGDSTVFRVSEGPSSNVLFAGASSYHGFYISTDAGVSWNSITSSLPDRRGLVNAIVAHPTGGVVIGLGSEPDAINPQGVYGVLHSTDNGQTWQDISSGLTNPDIRDLLIAPDGRLYAATNGGGVFRSTITYPVQLSHFSVE